MSLAGQPGSQEQKNKISQPHRGLALRPQTGQEVANVNEKERNRLPNCEFRRGAEQIAHQGVGPELTLRYYVRTPCKSVSTRDPRADLQTFDVSRAGGRYRAMPEAFISLVESQSCNASWLQRCDFVLVCIDEMNCWGLLVAG